MNSHSGPAKLNMSQNDGMFTILEQISSGSFFKTVKVTKGSKIVVLKAAVEESAMNTELLRREFEIARSISHPNIVDTLSFETDTPVGPAIVMEYIDGTTLSEWLSLKKGRRERFAVLFDLMSAAEYLHKKGILHNDIKPGNVIVNHNGCARLIDFGLSISDDSLYKGVQGGSEGFSAPEIMSGAGSAGAASDIYSIGKVFECLIPEKKFSTIVAKCLENNPSARYSSVKELRKAILLRRHRPVIFATVAFALSAIVASAIIFAQLGQRIQFHAQTLKAEELLNESYTRALSDMKRQKYSEFAGIVKGYYLMDYIKCESAISQDEKLALQAVFAEQSRVLDSIITSLPSVMTLPESEREPLIEMVNAGEFCK